MRGAGLILLAAIVTIVSFVWGMEVQRKQTPPYRTVYSILKWVNDESPYATWKDERRRPEHGTPGVWAEDVPNSDVSVASGETTPQIMPPDEVAQLQALGYLGATEMATDASGVTVNDPRAYPGLNLYNSGHAPEAVLMDMAGEVVHSWHITFADAFPEARPPPKTRGMYAFRRVHLFPNGELLAIFDGLGILRIDKDSKLLWARYNGAHHDMHVTEAGMIWVLTRDIRVHDRLHPWKEVFEDSITLMTPDGETIRSFSLIDAVFDSPLAPIMDLAETSGDIFHTNTLQLLDGSFEHLSPHFKRGNALISFRALNFVGVVDLEAERLVWALPHLSAAQHDPSFVPGGKILLLDNKWRREEKYSRVVEIDPLDHGVTWSYDGNASNGFYTSCCGITRRLPNGNTLITETDGGHAFEVTSDKEIVWEFFNPGRGGEKGELVGRLYDVQRIDPETVSNWTPSPSSN
jgi:hypothetical protein